MYKDLKNSPFYRNSNSVNPNRMQSNQYNPYNPYSKRAEISPEVRYGFEPRTTKKYSQENSDYVFDSLEDKEYEYEPKQKRVEKRSVNLEKYDDEHFFKHEEECEVCDYIELFQNMGRQEFIEMFVFSEVIGKPKALKKG